MNKTQILFDTIAGHLLNQNAKSENDTCQYRSSDGKMCAIGCLIDDKNYNGGLEGHGLTYITLSVTRSIGFTLSAKQFKMLGNFQEIHDRYDVEDWETEIEQLAKEFNLQW